MRPRRPARVRLSCELLEDRRLLATLAPNLVTNGGFETGDFSGWTQSGNTGATAVGSSPNAPNSGTYAAQLGPVGSLGYLTQDLSTTSGASYTLSFWWGAATDAGPPNEFQVSWNGTQLLDYQNFAPADHPAYQEFTFTVTATSTTTPLQFGFRQDPSYQGLDDISVVPTGTVVVPPDTTPPTSHATSPAYDNSGGAVIPSVALNPGGDGPVNFRAIQESGGFPVSFTAADNTGGSGLAEVDLYAQGPNDTGFSQVATDSNATDLANGSGQFTYAPTEGDGTYAFYTIAIDNAGNTESKTSADTTTLEDTQPPTSSASAPTYSTGPITVSYSAQDNSGGSGVATVQLWAEGPTDTGFSNTELTASDNHFVYTPTEGDGTYAFYTRATDNAGNQELTKSQADSGATTVEDTHPPVVDPPVITPVTGAVIPNADGSGATVAPDASLSGTISFAPPGPGTSWLVQISEPGATQTLLVTLGQTGDNAVGADVVSPDLSVPQIVPGTLANGKVTFAFAGLPVPNTIDPSTGGFYTITVTVTDVAGLSGSSTAPIKVLTTQQVQNVGNSVVTQDNNGAPVVVQSNASGPGTINSTLTVTGAVGTISLTTYTSKPIDDGSPPSQISVPQSGGSSTTYTPQSYYDISGQGITSTALTATFTATFDHNPGANFNILFWDPTANGGQGGWAQVLNADGSPPTIVITGPDQNGLYTATATVTISSTSLPTLISLTGTVFTIAVPAAPPAGSGSGGDTGGGTPVGSAPPPVTAPPASTASTTVQVNQPLAFVSSNGTTSDASAAFSQSLSLSSNATATLVLRVSPEVQFSVSRSEITAGAGGAGEVRDDLSNDDVDAVLDLLLGPEWRRAAPRPPQGGHQVQPAPAQPGPVPRAPRLPAESRLQPPRPAQPVAPAAVDAVFATGAWDEDFRLDDVTADAGIVFDLPVREADVPSGGLGAAAVLGLLQGATQLRRRRRQQERRTGWPGT